MKYQSIDLQLYRKPPAFTPSLWDFQCPFNLFPEFASNQLIQLSPGHKEPSNMTALGGFTFCTGLAAVVGFRDPQIQVFLRVCSTRNHSNPIKSHETP